MPPSERMRATYRPRPISRMRQLSRTITKPPSEKEKKMIDPERELEDLDDTDAYNNEDWHHDLDPWGEENDEAWIADELERMEERGDFL